MKIIVFLLLIISTGFLKVSGQVITFDASKHRKVSTDTSTNSDTISIAYNSIGSRVKAFQASVYKVSGTVTGYVLLRGTVNGTDWFDVNTDTLTNTNQATNKKVWLITATNFNSYRAEYRVASGTQVSILSFSYVRRPDE